MKTTILLLLLILPLAAAPPHGISMPVEIIDVHDGDSLTADCTFRLKVRLKGVWAPELNQAGGVESRDALTAAALGRKGTLFIPADEIKHIGQVTSLSRAIGEVWVDGNDESVNAQQVRLGFAAAEKGLR
jgi:endonuclease YncB( thermonuclease family)